MSDSQVHAVVPTSTSDSAPFWEACNRGELVLRRCAAGHVFHPPRLLCPRCGTTDLTWGPSSGTGTVHSFTEVHVSFYGAHWEPDLPYTVVQVDLDDGPRMLSRLWQPDGEIGAVAIGDRVRVRFVRVDVQALPFFEPDAGS